MQGTNLRFTWSTSDLRGFERASVNKLRPIVSLVSETGLFLSTPSPLKSGSPLLSLLGSARVRL